MTEQLSDHARRARRNYIALAVTATLAVAGIVAATIAVL
jgi:hypothetical protein